MTGQNCFGLSKYQSTKVTIQTHYTSIEPTINKNLLTELLAYYSF